MNMTEKSEETVESTEVFFEKNKISKRSAVRGLLSLAIKKAANACKGLLALASKYKKSAPAGGKGLLSRASKYKNPVSVRGKGLLALAGKREKQILARGKGLLAHACKMGIKADDKDDEEQDQIANINVVSPFSSMFLSLSEKE